MPAHIKNNFTYQLSTEKMMNVWSGCEIQQLLQSQESHMSVEMRGAESHELPADDFPQTVPFAAMPEPKPRLQPQSQLYARSLFHPQPEP